MAHKYRLFRYLFLLITRTNLIKAKTMNHEMTRTGTKQSVSVISCVFVVSLLTPFY